MKRPLLCGGSVLLSRHELCRIYALFWFDFDADFYADIEDFVQLLCRSLHEKMLGGTSDFQFTFTFFLLDLHSFSSDLNMIFNN